VSDWTQDNANYFRAIRIEKTMMSLILLLIVAVAAFNIVAMLEMVVTDKRTDIAIMRTFGAAPARVMGIFITQGLVIGWLGVALGVARSAYERLIGPRYLRSTHRRGFVSFVALISVCGLTLGVATLSVVLSVMNGFERELRSRILAVTSHATLMGLSGALPDWRALQQQIRRQSGVEAAVPYVESLCVLANGRRLAAAKVRGVLPEEERSAT